MSKKFKMVNPISATDTNLPLASNRLSEKPSEGENTQRNPAANGRFTFAVTEGNFPCHVIAELKKRGNWSQIDKETAIQSANFFWKQLNFNFR